MAILVGEKKLGGTVTQEGRQWRYEYIVRATDSGDAMSPVIAVNTLALPPYSITIGAPHPDDTDALVRSIDPQVYGDAGRAYQITVTWSTPRFGSSSPDPNPLNRDPEVEWDLEDEREPYFEDVNGRRVANSAGPEIIDGGVGGTASGYYDGERFDPLPEREVTRSALRWQRNEAEPDLATIEQYQNAVNDAPFVIDGKAIPTGVAKVKIRLGRKTVENNITYYPVEYFFKFRPQGWRESFLDVGLSEWRTSPFGDHRRPVLDEQGNPITSPVRLNGEGLTLEPTDESQYVGPFQPYEERDFSVFNFS